MTPDLDLLQSYAQQNSQDAFAALVSRHLNLVYSAALRQVRSPQLAEEVSQSVFTDLARNAATLKPDTILTAWLYQVTRRTAIDVVRRESRRQLREQIAVEINAMNATLTDWKDIEPMLDEAVSALDDPDRTAILLRYFENKSLRDVGLELGVGEDAAQKRVSRAVDQLRAILGKRGLTIAAGALVVVVSTNAVQAAPGGLVVTISTSALGGKAVIASTSATKIILMTTLQKTLVATLIATLAVGTGAYLAHRHNTTAPVMENKTDLPRTSWTDAGFATPQATLQTLGWSVINGDRERFKQCLSMTDGARSMIEEMIAATPMSEADKRLHPELLAMTAEDALLFPMMGQNKQDTFTAFHILAEKSLSATDKIFNVQIQTASGAAKERPFKFRQIGSDWKLFVDEDSMKDDYRKMQQMKARH